MLENLHIKNFKSIADESIDLGRINVFIGENGSGKSNILEALMMASLAETYEKVDADILYTNGVRVSKPSLMVSSFGENSQAEYIDIKLGFKMGIKSKYQLVPLYKDSITSKWVRLNKFNDKDVDTEALTKSFVENTPVSEMIELTENESIKKQLASAHESGKWKNFLEQEVKKFISIKRDEYKKSNLELLENEYDKLLSNFIIYTLNTEALRGIPEFQKSRKGIYGETLDKIVASLNEVELEELKEHVYGKIEWLEDFFIDEKDELKRDGYKMNNSQSLLYFKDKHMSEEGNNNLFSAENSNEGILHLLFYLANIISTKTSKLFAIDNIETALNPRLCEHTMEEICTLAKKHDKQILITTHNPAILDGLNLLDDEIRLFEVFRLDNGETKTRRIEMKPSVEGEKYKLSELWTRGYLGAISDRY
jgi:AAA15 family ATPase/GTPase